MYNFLLDLLSLGAILSGVLVITNKNPVISVIFLISLFINAAGYLIILGLGFVGIAYILIYIGAITVLFLFVIMMININLEDIQEVGSQYSKNLPLALSIAFLFIYEFFTIMPFTFSNVSIISYALNYLINLNSILFSSNIANNINNDIIMTINPVIADSSIANFTQIEAIGHFMYTYGAIWLIICSIILLLSMIAPIFMHTKQEN